MHVEYDSCSGDGPCCLPVPMSCPGCPGCPWALPDKEMPSSIDDLMCFRQTSDRTGQLHCHAQLQVLPVGCSSVCESHASHAWDAVPGWPGWAVWNEGVLGVLLTCQALMQPSGGCPRWPGRPVTSDERPCRPGALTPCRLVAVAPPRRFDKQRYSQSSLPPRTYQPSGCILHCIRPSRSDLEAPSNPHLISPRLTEILPRLQRFNTSTLHCKSSTILGGIAGPKFLLYRC